MKRILFAFAFLGTMVSCGQEKKEIASAVATQQAEVIQWKTMNEALEAQKQNPKKILVYFHAQWCPVCKRMNLTYENKEVAKYINEHYYAVKFDVESNEQVDYQGKTYGNPNYKPNAEVKYGGNGAYNEFPIALGVKAFPTMIIFDESTNPIIPFPGYLSPRNIEPYLAVFATDEYRAITSQEQWEAYINNFEYKNKE